MIFLLRLIGIACVAVTAWLTGWLSGRIRRHKPFVFTGGLALCLRVLPDPESAGKDFAVLTRTTP
ncbi:hypothetical protein ACWEGE_38700 [Amycolatopsis sp. NPDC004747]